MTFKKISEQKIKKFLVEEFEHIKTGAKHTHINVEGGENAFNISFKTPVTDRKGLPHIIEHLILNGSKNYPVDNMFLKLMGRNFETMLNASTSNDFTTFYYSSNVEEGYLKLNEVFLDAVLNPLLTEKAFLTEGFRYELDEQNNLKFSGVVYNEMMAWVGKLREEEIFRKALGAHSSNEFAGGDPLFIADVKHQDILDFHKKYYNPSNAHVFTTGDINVEKIHKNLDKYFDKFEKTEAVRIKPFVIKNINNDIKIKHTGDNVLKTFLFTPLGEYEESKFRNLNILESLVSVYINNYFKENKLGMDFSHFEIKKIANQMVLLVSFNVENEDRIPEVEKEWNNSLAQVIKNGVDSEVFESLFNNTILVIKQELKSGYASRINVGTTMNVNSGLAIENFLVTEQEVLNNKKYFSQKDIIEKLIRENLMNKEIIKLSSIPDDNFINEYNEKIKNKEMEINSIFTKNEKLNLANKINVLPSLKGNVDILPEVKITKEIKLKKFSNDGIVRNVHNIDGAKIIIADVDDGSDGAVVKLHLNFVPENEDEVCYEIISQHIHSFTNNKNSNKQETTLWRQDKISSLSIDIEEKYDKEIENQEESNIYSTVVIQGFKNNIPELFKKSYELYTIQDIDTAKNLKTYLIKIKESFEQASNNHLHNYLGYYAKKSMKNGIFQYINEIKVLRKIEDMIESLSNGNDFYFEELKSYYNSERRLNNKVFEAYIKCDISDEKNVLKMLKESNVLGENKKVTSTDLEELINIEEKQNNTLLLADTSSAFASICFENPYQQNDVKSQAKIKILSNYIGTILFNQLRIEQGTYGAFVTKDADTINMLAYRTPDPVEALNVMKNVFIKIIEDGVDKEILENVKRKEITPLLNYKSKSEILSLRNAQRVKSFEDVVENTLETILSFKDDEIIGLIKEHFLNNNNYVVSLATNEEILKNNQININDFEIVDYPSQKINVNKSKKLKM